MKKNKTIKFLVFLSFCLIWASPALAAVEIVYPPINLPFGQTLTLNNESTLAEAVIYFYSLFAAVAAIIVFTIIVWAGLEMVISSGNAGKFSAAKKRILGAIVGLVVLASSYIILNAISPMLIKPKNVELNCDTTPLPVCAEFLTKTPEGKEKVSIEMNVITKGRLDLQPGETLTIKRFSGLKEVWGYSKPDWAEGEQLLYRDENPLTQETLDNPLLSPIVITPAIKSIKIFPKVPGFYLYKTENSAPVFFDRSRNDLNSAGGQIEIIDNFKNNEMYHGIAFNQVNYNNYGKPSAFSSSGSRCYVINPLTWKDTLMKVPFAKSIMMFSVGSKDSLRDRASEELGELVFYNTVNCGQGDIQARACTYRPAYGESWKSKSINQVCPEWQGEKILSFRITGSYGVVLTDSAANDSCKYWDKDVASVSDNCIGYDNFLITQKPQNFFVIPYNNKLL
ncbi:MAG: pilin [Candidatus Paceibacterota bacterium]